MPSEVKKPESQPVQQIQYQVQSGPLPSPEILSKYDSIKEGFAERIMQMAEANNQHIIFQEKKALEAQIWEIRLGQLFALVIGVAGLGSATAIAYFGHPITASFIGIGGLGTLVGAFIMGRGRQKAVSLEE